MHIYLLDAASFLIAAAVLMLLAPRPRASAPATTDRGNQHGDGQPVGGYRQVIADRLFIRVWLLIAMLIFVGYGQYHTAFPAFATRTGGIEAGALGYAFAANTFTVVAAQLLILRAMTGRRRTTGLALAAAVWAAAWAVTLIGEQLGSGRSAIAAFVVAMVVFGIAETLLAPCLMPIVNDIAPDELRGRYNAVATLGWTAGFLGLAGRCRWVVSLLHRALLA